MYKGIFKDVLLTFDLHLAPCRLLRRLQRYLCHAACWAGAPSPQETSASGKNWERVAAPQWWGARGAREILSTWMSAHITGAGSVLRPRSHPWAAAIQASVLTEAGVCGKCYIEYNLLPKSFMQVFLWILSYTACHMSIAAHRSMNEHGLHFGRVHARWQWTVPNIGMKGAMVLPVRGPWANLS